MEKPLHPSWTSYALFSLRYAKFFLFSFIISFSFFCFESQAQSYPSGFSQVLVANGINNPTVMAFAPDGRIFVAQQNGQLRVIKNGSLLSQPFVSLSVSASGERGLLGIAFDPNFSSNGYIYLYYTVSSGSYNRISRFTASGDVAVSGSEQVLLNLDPLSGATNHNGGTMQFGPDGKLYVGIGENADASYSQRTDTYHGKILRINTDGSVPPGNPFTDGNEQRRRIWALGVRNPYTIAFQPGTGRLFVNDVGASSWEEVNDATSGGKNFGWPQEEGWGNNFSGPIYAYGHGGGVGSGCAITGGTFFNPSSTNYPSTYQGRYFFMDYCNNWIDMLTLNGGSASRSNFASNIAGSALSITTGPDGNLYFISRDNSAVYKIVYSGGSSAPVITNQPQSITVSEGNNATFSISATGSSLSYQWRRNGNNISGANSSSYTINNVTTANAGTYSVVISNGGGSVTSNNATLTVTSANQAPSATINSPASGSTYAGGSVISFSGSATDPENGNLSSGSYSWYVIFHHDSHTHPGPLTSGSGSSGSFTIPNTGETAANVFYRLYLVVTDPQGARDTAWRDIMPRTSTMTLNTNPQGLTVTLDGQPFTAPLTVTSVEGVLRSIGVPSPQNNYSFTGWAHGGSQTQTLATPVNNTTYTANFASPVSISSQPQSITVDEGDNASFSVTASGSGPFSYQWRRNGSNISGANSSTYAITSVTAAQAGTYSVVVSNGSGSVTSSNATLTVTTAPAITSQPQSTTVAQGGNASFTVSASGSAPLSYQWRKNGSNISGANASSYTLTSVDASDAGTYSVVVSNGSGSVTSNNATLTVTSSPVITSQPQSATVAQGGNASFSVTASGTPPLSYQWRKNGSNISGANDASYSLTSVDASDAGTYSVVVSNGSGSVTSNNSTLTVTSTPVITSQPQSITRAQGSSATFSVTATGTPTLRYQWRRNGTNISGATSSSYTISSVGTSSGGNYSVVVSNNYGSVTSNNAVLMVATSPVITGQPQSTTVAQGASATFTVTATGSNPLSYQWRRNGTNISGAVNSSYSIASVNSTHAGTYSVVVTNSYGNAVSANATLSVSVNNQAPVATITTPAAGTTYAGGTVVNFSGTISDPESGNLAATAYSWYVLFYHGSHSHPGPAVTANGNSGSFTIPTTGETATDVFYRIYLVATDAQGLKDTAYRDLLPRTSTITLNTIPQGLTINLDGDDVITPHTVTSVEGIERIVSLASPQTLNGTVYTFNRWMHGGDASQTIVTAASDASYTASFTAATPGEDSTLRDPDHPVNPVNGLDYFYYHGTWNQLPDFNTWRKEKAGTVNNFSLSPRTENDNFGFRYDGFVSVPANGEYTFYVSSDEGSRLYIGDQLVVDNDGLHAVQERSGKIGLKAGLHQVRVEYFDKSMQQELSVSYEGPGIEKQAIPDTALFRDLATVYTFDAFADAHVQSGSFNNVNMGANPILGLGNSNNNEIFLRFDISGLREGISSAKLRLYGGLHSTNVESVTVDAYNVASHSWLERTITNSNKPSEDRNIIASTIVSSGEDRYYEWDLTDHIAGLRSNGALYVSLVIKTSSSTGNGLVQFNSRENTANAPQLQVQYSDLITGERSARPSGTVTKSIQVEDVRTASCFAVYPNPVRDNFTMSFSTSLRNQRMQITDINGRVVKEVVLNGSNTQNIRVDDLKEGMYFLNVSSGKSKCTQKIMIGK